MFFWTIFIIGLGLGVWALYLLFRSGDKKPTPIAPQGPLIEPGVFHDDERCLSYEERESYNRRWLEERRRRQMEDDILYAPVVVEPAYVPDVTVPDSSGFAGFGGGDSGGAGASSDWGSSSDSGSCDSSSSDSGSCDTGS